MPRMVTHLVLYFSGNYGIDVTVVLLNLLNSYNTADPERGTADGLAANDHEPSTTHH